MYSKPVESLLEKAGAKPGARIRVTEGKRVSEGVLMPRSDAGDSSCIVLKLDSGYNTGIAVGPKSKVEVLEGGAVLERFATARRSYDPRLPAVSLIATGGTISSRVDYRTGGVHMLMSPEEILAQVPELASVVNLRSVLSPFRMASEDMGGAEWCALAGAVAKELNDGSRGVMVTHGTDTLHYTSAALSFMLKGLCKPVAVVGAQRSPDRASFDGAMNLLCASHYAVGNIAEVSVVMHGSSSDDYCLAVPGTKARKMHSSRRDSFRSINALPFARVWPDGATEFLRKDFHSRCDCGVVADAVFERKTALLKVVPGASAELLDYLADKGYRGVVLEATGLGHVPTSPSDSKYGWLPSVEKAVESGMVVAVSSQCIYGRVHPFVYSNARRLHAAGAVFCGDMLAETAYVKLGWLLGHKEFSAQDVGRKMVENVAGELNPRLAEEDFLV